MSLRTRRDFLKTTGVATVALVESSVLGSAGLLAAGPYVRRDIAALNGRHPVVQGYQTAVKAMRSLPSSDPRSWAYQAAIHGTAVSQSLPAWNTCEHGTYFFLSWHRMYLWYFERIVRKMSGQPDWALPFWNYAPAAARTLPGPFRQPADSGNPLYTADRGAGWNTGAEKLNASAVNTGPALGEVAFDEFSDELESTPHAAVHIQLGGWMGQVDTAAQDPIFWLHHCNIDRLWNAWLAQGGGRTDPLTDTAWTGTKFTFFDESGAQVQLTGCEVLRAQEQLDYGYEAEPAQVKLYCQQPPQPARSRREVMIQLPPPVLKPGPEPTSVDVDVREARQRMKDAALAPEADLRVDLEGVEADRQPSVYYELYAGMPKGETPSFEGPYYLGNIALFGHGVRGGHGHGEFRPARFSFKMDRAMQAVMKQPGPEPDRITMLFVPRGAEGAGRPGALKDAATIRIGRMSISARRIEK